MPSDASRQDERNPAWAPFAHRDFTLYFVSRFFSGASSQMINVAVGWLIYDMTQSAFALGLIGLCIFAPNVIFALVAGHVADRFDRRMVLMICYAGMTLSSLGLLLGVMSGGLSVTAIFLLIGLLGTAKAFSNPAGQAILPNLVPREIFPRAVATMSWAWQTATIAGPALGGLLYAFGADKVFFATTVLNAACLICLVLLKPGLRVRSKEPVTWEYLTAGVRFIWGHQILLGSISLDLFAVLLGGATALLPIYARDILETGPSGLGALRTAPAVGAFITGLVLAHIPELRQVGRKMFIAVAVFGLATIGFGFSTNFYAALIFLAILGAADMVSVFIRVTLMQIETPDEMRGRVSAVNTLFIGASNELGEFESGILAGLVGAVPAVVIGGVGSLAVTGLWAMWFPQLRDRDRLAQGPHKTDT